MKKVTKPSTQEEAVYYSDFSGKCFGEYQSPVEITLDFNYGSKYDGSKVVFHMDDNDVDSILELISKNLCESTKKELLKAKHKSSLNYDESVDFRDWHGCDYHSNNISLLKKLLNLND